MDYENSGGGNFASPGNAGSQGDGKFRKATDEQTLIPVTIKMLLAAAKSNNTLQDGREPHQVKIVAAVREVTKGSTSYNYTVEDGTGAIEVKEWIEDGNITMTQMREDAAMEHQYIRIVGKLGEYDNKPQVVAHSVRKVTTGNELTHHFLEVVHSAEKYNKQGGHIVGSPSMAMGGMNFNAGGMQASTPIGMNNNMAANDGGDLQDAITNFLRSCKLKSGCCVALRLVLCNFV